MSDRLRQHVIAHPALFWHFVHMKAHRQTVCGGFARIAVMTGIASLSLPIANGNDWPQWAGGPQNDGAWHEDGIVTNFPSGGLTSKWRTPIGPGYSGPSAANGSVFVMDRQNFGTNAPAERVLCLDASTGKIHWQYSYPCKYSNIGYDSGPRVTPAVVDGRVYTLGTMGDLICLDAADGKPAWQKNLPRDDQAKIPTWGFATQLLVDGSRLYCIVGGPGHALVAFEAATGKELWRALSSREPGYSTPLIRTINGQRQLIVRHSDGIAGLTLDTGEVLWSAQYPAKMGMAVCTPAVFENLICLSGQFEGTAMFKVLPDKKEAALLWSFDTGGKPETEFRRDGFNSPMSTVVFNGKQVYGVSLHGELCGLEAATGHRIWTSLALLGGSTPKDKWWSAFFVRHHENYFVLNENGDLQIARFSPTGYELLAKTHLCDPDMPVANRKVIWSHPAFANRCIYVRSNSELMAFSLAADGTP